MLTSIKNLIGFHLKTRSGKFGDIKDIYFDDQSWSVRYFLVEIGSWLSKREVLIAADLVRFGGLKQHFVVVSLTKEQVRHSPEGDTCLPVSRQWEQSLFDHSSWMDYGSINRTKDNRFVGAEILNVVTKDGLNAQDPHLRSLLHVAGYRVNGALGIFGRMRDFLVETDSCKVSNLLTDTALDHDEFQIVPVTQISYFDWLSSEIQVELHSF